MIHEEFEQSFTSGLNVITGPTKTGKTCVFKALQFLFNQCMLSEKDYRREKTKETVVTGELSNGCIVTRTKSNSINRYILTKDGHEFPPFDSFGKEVPEEIANALEISRIDVGKEHIYLNFADQDDMNFLIDNTYSDGLKAQLFNKLTGNEILDKMFKELNREALKTGKDIKTSEELIETQEGQIGDYSLSYKTLNKQLCMVTKELESIEKHNKELDELKSLNVRLDKIKETEEFITYKLSKIKYIDDKEFISLKSDAKEIDTLSVINNRLQNANKELLINEQNLKSIKIVDVDFNELRNNEQMLQNLIRLDSLIASLVEKEQTIAVNIKESKDKLKIREEEIAQFKLKNPQCPLCGKDY